MNTEILLQGSKRNTLSLEYQLFWNFSNPNFINERLASRSRKNYTRWCWQHLRWNKNSILASASQDGCIEIVKLMLEKGANNYDGAMVNATANGHFEIVKMMAEKGAVVYNTALVNASHCGHLDIVKLMLAKGADDYNGALYYARRQKHRKIIEYLTSLMSS